MAEVQVVAETEVAGAVVAAREVVETAIPQSEGSAEVVVVLAVAQLAKEGASTRSKEST